MKKVTIKCILLTILITHLSHAENLLPLLPNSPEIKWVDAINLPKGAKLAILTGNPQRKEFYTARLKLPANFIIPAHSHINDEYNTVMSGTYYMGLGNNMDKNRSIPLPPESFIKFRAGLVHYGFTKEETIIEISGIGPWGTMPTKLKLPT